MRDTGEKDRRKQGRMTIQLDHALLDVGTLRRDFPILQRTLRGKPLAYLASASTSQKPRAVLDALDAYYARSNANVHRAVYELAEEATAAYEGARAKVAA